ncbi:MAG: hypothetical protein GAK30_02937 [Paracidovorax wautersii]|uniref:Tripartite-type tricarboxylate transporter, receptor component TctC n=1 Tax=Paracidovorax wautersii TaxID=1177982 RepID=A0A7V8FM78_9BURK|nr:MAG: hypothetical protein GAK30_02937 [Paracidovorax wautersii]
MHKPPGHPAADRRLSPSRRRLLQTLLAAPAIGWLGAPARAAAATNFPTKALRVVVPFGPGGVADLTARVVTQHMAQTLGQAVIVDNKPGAGGVVAADSVAKSAPDGHTLLLMSNANAISARLFKTLPFDPVGAFQPVSTLGTFDLALFVPANSPFKTFADFVTAARSKPGALNVGTINVGSTQHLTAELMKTAAGIDVQVVPFNGSPAVFTALRGGQVDATVEILTPMMSQVKAGAARALVVTNERRSPALPDTPTAREAGAPQWLATSWNALAAPSATPREVVERLNHAIRAAVADGAVHQQLEELYIDPRASSPQEAGDLLRREIARWGAVIERAHIPQQG